MRPIKKILIFDKFNLNQRLKKVCGKPFCKINNLMWRKKIYSKRKPKVKKKI